MGASLTPLFCLLSPPVTGASGKDLPRAGGDEGPIQIKGGHLMVSEKRGTAALLHLPSPRPPRKAETYHSPFTPRETESQSLHILREGKATARMCP